MYNQVLIYNYFSLTLASLALTKAKAVVDYKIIWQGDSSVAIEVSQGDLPILKKIIRKFDPFAKFSAILQKAA